MEPFEISLTFIRVLGEKKTKKKTAQEFFSSVPRRKVLGNTKSSSTVKCLSVCLLIYLGLFWYLVFCAGLWGFSQTFMSKKEKVVYLFFCPIWQFSLTATRDSRLVFVFFGMVELSSLSPPHWAQISALWRQVNVTKHGAICSAVMHHGLTADIKSTLWWIYAPACSLHLETFRQALIRTLV